MPAGDAEVDHPLFPKEKTLAESGGAGRGSEPSDDASQPRVEWEAGARVPGSNHEKCRRRGGANKELAEESGDTGGAAFGTESAEAGGGRGIGADVWVAEGD